MSWIVSLQKYILKFYPPGPQKCDLTWQQVCYRCNQLRWGQTAVGIECMLSCSAVSDSATPWTVAHQASLLPWNYPGKNTGVGCPFLLQGIFLTQGLRSHLLCLQTGVWWVLIRLSGILIRRQPHKDTGPGRRPCEAEAAVSDKPRDARSCQASPELTEGSDSPSESSAGAALPDSLIQAHCHSLLSQALYGMDVLTIFASQMHKRRLREAKKLGQGHTANEWGTWDAKARQLGLEPKFIATTTQLLMQQFKKLFASVEYFADY